MRLTRIAHNWKEAATIILFSKNGVPKLDTTKTHPLGISASRPSGTKPSEEVSSRDFRIVSLERTSKSTFMPSAYVFPGGRISEEDYSHKWLSIYQKCGVSNLNCALPVPAQDPKLRAPMFTRERDWPVDSNVAFRICSIRETFEEAGILICRHSDDILQGGGTTVGWKSLNKRKLQEWRPAIQSDPAKFVEMCEEFSVVPDIWSLHEWSCWLTPTNMDKLHGGRRFDTAFYICGLPKHVDAVHDQQEIVQSKWIDPAHLLKAFTEQQIWLAPPQIYELRRLCHFTKSAELRKFAKDRENHGCARWLPVRLTFNDGILPVLPGDDLYPTDVDLEGTLPPPEYNQSMAESTETTKNVHRFEIPNFKTCTLTCNIPQTNGHLEPKPLEEIFEE